MIQHVPAILAAGWRDSSTHFGIISRSTGQNDTLRTVILLSLAVLHAVALIPVFFYIVYTVCKVFPILAIVESRPSYEAIPLQEASDMSCHELNSLQTEEPGSATQTPLTSSIRRMHELVKKTDHMWLRRRGVATFVVYNLAGSLVSIPLRAVPLVPGFLWDAVAVLLTIQLHTLWVHVVITPPMAKPFWKRILPFSTVFKATVAASLIYSLTTELTIFIPLLAAQVLSAPFALSQVQTKPSDLWKMLLSFSLFIAIQALVCIPALVALTRIQASLLPEGEVTILPVDRAFGVDMERGKYGDRDGLSILEALKSFNGSWMRLYKLYIKILFLILGCLVGLGAILGLEFLALRAFGVLP